jgi:hypothetical protein
MRSRLISLLGLLSVLSASPVSAGPDGQMTWGLHFSPTPGWFDPFKLAELLPHSTLCTRCTTP